MFMAELDRFSWLKLIKSGLLLFLHLIPYLILFCTVGRLFVFRLFGVVAKQPSLSLSLTKTVLGFVIGITTGIIVGITLSIFIKIVDIIGGRIDSYLEAKLGAEVVARIIIGSAVFIWGGILGVSILFSFIGSGYIIGILLGNFRWGINIYFIVFFIANTIALVFAFDGAKSITRVVGISIICGMIYNTIIRWPYISFSPPYSSGFAENNTETIVSSIAYSIAMLIVLLRLFYFPFHWLLVWPKLRMNWAQYHPVLWDDRCLIPFSGLHRLLVAQTETQRWRGKYNIERIIAYYPAQRIEALKAKVILLARRTGRLTSLTNLTDLERLLARLPEGEKGFLAQTPRIRVQVSEIRNFQTLAETVTLPTLRAIRAEMLVKEIEDFRERISGYHEPLATEFRAAASQWLRLAQRQLDECRQNVAQEAAPQVFRAGDPVDLQQQEAFTPRYPVIESLRQQVMLKTGCPGIVLYGRRRMGKSTLLRNLTGFLPSEVLTVNVSLQNPQLAASLASFTHTLAEQMQTQASGLKLNEALPDDLPGLFGFLTTVNKKLATEQKRLLLAVDEYEALDAKIGAGVFPHDLLDTLRESIQTHRRLTWIFAGSHEITELPHAAWTSALVSARTIEVPAFTLAETRLLLTEPLKHSSLWRGNEAKRPRFDAAFWGTEEGSGIDYIHAQAGGWPHLVQLIAETLVDLVNEEEAPAVTPELLQRALDKAIVRGHNVLYELLRRECTLPGEWEYLERFKKLDAQPAPNGSDADEAVARSLRRRELMALDGDEWRLRVPLMLRWLRVRG
jgi:hypothetical protein